MLITIKKLLERSAYYISTAITIAIIYLSLSSLENLPVKITVSDKFLHSLAYLVLTLSWFFAVKRTHSNNIGKLLIVIIIFIFGFAIEVMQEKFTENRMMDYLDVIANSIGIIIALFSFNYLLKVYKMI